MYSLQPVTVNYDQIVDLAGGQCSLHEFSKCVTAGASAKLLAIVRKPPGIAEQTVTSTLATGIEDVKIGYFR